LSKRLCHCGTYTKKSLKTALIGLPKIGATMPLRLSEKHRRTDTGAQHSALQAQQSAPAHNGAQHYRRTMAQKNPRNGGLWI